MARLLFGVGAIGRPIELLQAALLGAGYDPKGTDGHFGHDTRKAVERWQKGAGAAKSGAITDTEWLQLTGAPVPSVEERCLGLTASIEGHGYTIAQGNWDDAWLTWGIVGFTLKSGSLQAVVDEVQRTAKRRIDEAFGTDAATFLEVLASPRARQKSWATSISAGSRVVEPWRTHFERFGSFPEVQAAQRAVARRNYFEPAVATAHKLGLVSELGLALCFDIHVQNGGVKRASMTALRPAVEAGDERRLRLALAEQAAQTANPAYASDVRARKRTMATGQGTVHGRVLELANWGLDEFPSGQ